VRAASPDRPTRGDDVEVVRFATCNADAGELILGVLVSLFPFYWMVVMAANATADILECSVVRSSSMSAPRLLICYSMLINASSSAGCVRAFQVRCATD
jgi:hypothetical protein